MASFADILPSATDRPRVLWRIDHNAKAEVLLYIVAPSRPDLTHLVEQAGWPTLPPGWQTYDYTTFLDKVDAGSTWAFRLTANPVHSIRREAGEPTKRTAHRTPRHQMQWLLQRQEASGFRVLEKPAERRLTSEGDEFELVVHGGRTPAGDAVPPRSACPSPPSTAGWRSWTPTPSGAHSSQVWARRRRTDAG